MRTEAVRTLGRHALGLSLLLFLGAGPRASAAGPAAIEAKRYLFLDPALLASTRNLELTINPADRREIVLRPDRPWESLMFGFFSSTLQEGDRVRLWYLARTKSGERPGGMAYAESLDGVHFTKPFLGLVEFNDSTDNNLVRGGENGMTPFIDPNAPPAERYVAVSNIDFPRGGVGRYTSPDGLRWKHDPPGLFRFSSDTQNVTFWDQRLGKYVVYLRSRSPEWRHVIRLEVGSLTAPSGVKRRDDLPTVFAADEDDPVRSEVYCMAAQPYPLDPSWYVAFPSFLRRSEASNRPDKGGLGHHRGPVDTEFAGSRDGITWHRYDRTAYASPMVASPEKRNMLFMGSGLVVRGDEIWQYAAEFESEHGDVEAREKKQDGVIVRYVQRVDGFVSLTAGNTEGTGRTVPVPVTGERLLLNLDTGALGDIQVGLLDEDGGAIKGFSLAECPPLQINATGVPVAWPHGDLATLKGKKVCLEIRMRRTKLYSFRFE